MSSKYRVPKYNAMATIIISAVVVIATNCEPVTWKTLF